MELYEKIVRLSFEKASEKGVRDNKNAKAIHLSEALDKFIDGSSIRKETLTQYYNKYVLREKGNFKEPTLRVFDALAKHLDFKDFIDFKNSHNEKIKLLEETKNQAIDKKENILERKITGKETGTTSSKNKKLPFKPLIIVGMIMMFLISIWIVKDMFKAETTIIPQKIEITNHNYHGDLNYYYNIDDKGKIELYDKKGMVSENQLVPVTKEIMLTYFEQNNDEDIRKWTKETILDKDEKIEEVLTEKELKKESKNTALIKPKAIKSTKVVITNNTIFDAFASMTFKQKYTKVKEKYTCTGTVEYTYKESSISNKLTVCNAVLVYTVISNSTGEEIDFGSIVAIGIGTSESEAQQNAISKILFK